MGKTWGNLYYIRHIIYVRLSPYELNPFKRFWQRSFNGIKQDFVAYGTYLIPSNFRTRLCAFVS